MNVLSIPLMVIAGITFYEGMNYLYIHRVFRRQKEYLYFSFICFSFSLYSLFDFHISNSHTPLDGIAWQKWLLVTVPIIMISLTLFVYAVVDKKKDRLFYWIVGALIPLIVTLALLPESFLSFEMYNLRSYSVGKFTADFVEKEAVLLGYFIVVLLTLVFIYLFVLLFKYYKKYHTKKALLMMISCGLVFLAGIFNGCVALRLIKFPYIAEYIFLGMVVAMNRILLQQLFILHNKIASMNLNLEDQVRSRTEELHTVNMNLREKVEELALAKKKLEESNLYVENIVNSMPDGLIVSDMNGTITKINAVAQVLLTRTSLDSSISPDKEIVGRNVAHFFPGNSVFEDYPLNVFSDGESKRDIEVQITLSDNETRFFSASALIVRDLHFEDGGTVITLRDISCLKELENSLRYLATHDTLTELPNRLLFQDRAKQAFLRAHRVDSCVSIQLIDFDHFKEINDTLGHNAGDSLLRQASARIQQCLREYDTVARMGGDEFVVLLSDLTKKEEASMIAERICAMFREPFMLRERRIVFTPSIGISLYPTDGDSIETLLKMADIAMYSAKSAGGNRYCFFSDEMKDAIEENMSIKEQLQYAIDRNELVLYYQPLVETMSGKVVAAEALLRWEHPHLGIISPMKFIPIAEKTGKIVSIGKWVLSKACMQCKEWHSKGFPIPVTVNISARQLEEAGFVDSLIEILAATGLPATYLIIEITETAAMYNEAFSLSVLEKVHEMGVAIYIDDFGSGYSSFQRIKKLPVSALKIDQFLTQHIIDDTADATILKTIIAMAYSMGLKVIVEGVETEEQLNFIKNLSWKFDGELKCDQIQGYFFSKPVPVEQLYHILNGNRHSVVSP